MLVRVPSEKQTLTVVKYTTPGCVELLHPGRGALLPPPPPPPRPLLDPERCSIIPRIKEKEGGQLDTHPLHISYRSSWPMPGPSWTSGGGSSKSSSSSVYVSVVPGA
ncbi:unnamed protein product [Pleuronectes platessa]|uniref:Uncharacterized protein n=1 Tax=Pleuronectes platessa TaxID=8262 RepID=A0A9N7V1N2_PLEPL|nr:unnamed protein product [Pleuronectes platessa]